MLLQNVGLAGNSVVVRPLLINCVLHTCFSAPSFVPLFPALLVADPQAGFRLGAAALAATLDRP